MKRKICILRKNLCIKIYYNIVIYYLFIFYLFSVIITARVSSCKWFTYLRLLILAMGQIKMLTFFYTHRFFNLIIAAVFFFNLNLSYFMKLNIYLGLIEHNFYGRYKKRVF